MLSGASVALRRVALPCVGVDPLAFRWPPWDALDPQVAWSACMARDGARHRFWINEAIATPLVEESSIANRCFRRLFGKLLRNGLSLIPDGLNRCALHARERQADGRFDMPHAGPAQAGGALSRGNLIRHAQRRASHRVAAVRDAEDQKLVSRRPDFDNA